MASKTSAHQIQHRSELHSSETPESSPPPPSPSPAPLSAGSQPLIAKPPPPSCLQPHSPPSSLPTLLTSSHPRPWEGKRPTPSLERKPQAQPGPARGKGGLLMFLSVTDSLCFHRARQPHSRVDSPGAVNKQILPLNKRGHNQMKNQILTLPLFSLPSKGFLRAQAGRGEGGV